MIKKNMIYTCYTYYTYDLYLYSSQALLSCIELGPQLAFGWKASFSLSTGNNHVGGDDDGDGDYDGDDNGDDEFDDTDSLVP